MKKTYLGRIAALAAVLCLVTCTLMSGTLAKYTSEAVGTGTVNVAQWSGIKFKDGAAAATFSFDLKDTKETNVNVTADQIAPGDKGSFEVGFGPAEVAYKYSIDIAATSLTATTAPIKFYSDAARTTAWSKTAADVALADAGTAKTVTVYWAWDTANTDADDTTAGIANSALNFTVTITAEQTTTP